MLDLITIAGLFGEAFGVSKQWTAPRAEKFDPLEDAFRTKVVRDLQAKDHRFEWALATGLRRLKEEGWLPVYERDAIGRPTIFVDRLEELVLVHRAPQSAA